jgi:hypothetical protein
VDLQTARGWAFGIYGLAPFLQASIEQVCDFGIGGSISRLYYSQNGETRSVLDTPRNGHGLNPGLAGQLASDYLYQFIVTVDFRNGFMKLDK